MRNDLRIATAAVLANPSPSITDGWRARLITNEKGKGLPIVANALIALQHAPEWAGVLAFDQSSFNTIAKNQPPWDDLREPPFVWTDEDDIRTAAWLQHEGIMAAKETAGQAVQTIARDHGFHPIRDYLDSLKWDRVKRIGEWLTLYLGVDPSDYVRAVGAKWLIGGVARIYKPGCKNDCSLILEGSQGTLKSTALGVLAKPWFTDSLAEIGSKDSALETRGVWLIELSELDSLARPEVSRIKAYMSRATDRFRPPFGRRPIEAPRECFFAGTSNHSAYLRDETGARRFWPVKCGVIRIDELRRDRDQLWAEAREQFKTGVTWWLEDKQLIAAAADEQKQRYEGDTWDEKINHWIAEKDTVTVGGILEFCLEIKPGLWKQSDQNRVARCLRAAGWERFRVREGKQLGWRYRKVMP